MTKTSAPRAGAGGAVPPKESAHKPESKGRREKSQRNSTAHGGMKAVPSQWWVTPAFLALPAVERDVLLMLWTSPQTPLIGIVEYTPEAVAAKLRIKPVQARSAIVRLFNDGFVDMEVGEPLVCLIGHVEAQLRGLPAQSPKWLKATMNALERLPQTAVIDRFRQRYGLPAGQPQGKGYAKGYHMPYPKGALNPNRSYRETKATAGTTATARPTPPTSPTPGSVHVQEAVHA